MPLTRTSVDPGAVRVARQPPLLAERNGDQGAGSSRTRGRPLAAHRSLDSVDRTSLGLAASNDPRA